MQGNDLSLPKLFKGIFAGWGESQIVAVKYDPVDGQLLTLADTKAAWEGKVPAASTPHSSSKAFIAEKNRRKTGLSTLFSAPIAGCDLLSSCLYTAGTTAGYAGKLTPVGLGLVTLMLCMYRRVYQEVVTALPNNGGVYNALLNTSTKRISAFAACLSMLSYVATAIVSAFDAVLYLAILWPSVDLRAGTIVILGLFAVLTMFGVSDSSYVSFALFSCHVFMMSLLIVWSVAYGFHDNWQTFIDNTNAPYPDIYSSTDNLIAAGSAGAAIFYGFSAGLLGISGFESAANYVEEMQENRVYVRTLDIMWLMSGFYNPSLGLVSMFVMPLEDIYHFEGSLLAEMGSRVSGSGFANFIAADAVMVLSGAVLTSYIGINGLIRRMAQDRVYPDFLLQVNPRGSNHWIILLFFVLCSTLYLAIFDPSNPTAINVFGGVYALSFLLVMFSFAFSCLMLKVQRPDMSRLVVTHFWELFACMSAVTIGIAGNIILTPTMIQWFFIYESFFVFIVFLMFHRVLVIKGCIWLIRTIALLGESNEEVRKHNEELVKAHDLQENYDDSFYGGIKGLPDNVKVSLSEKALAAEEKKTALAINQAAASDTAGIKSFLSDKHGSEDDKKNASAPPALEEFSYSDLKPPVDSKAASALSSPLHHDLKLADTSTLTYPPVSATSAELRASPESEMISINRPTAPRRRSHTPSTIIDPPLASPDQSGIRAGRRTSSLANLFSRKSDVSIIKNRRSDSMAKIQQLSPQMISWLQTTTLRAPKMGAHIIPSSGEFQQTQAKPMDQDEIDEIELVLSKPFFGAMLTYCLGSLNKIVSEPMIFLAKTDDPLCLHQAIDYVVHNELTQRIIVVHIVDDRETIKGYFNIRNSIVQETTSASAIAAFEAESNRILLQAFMGPKEDSYTGPLTLNSLQDGHPDSFLLARAWQKVPPEVSLLIENVATLDAFYSSVNVSCMIVRGTFFSPDSVHWLSRFLGVALNSMLMGMPDTSFQYSIAQFTGCRVVLNTSSKENRERTHARLDDIHNFSAEMRRKAQENTSKLVSAKVIGGKIYTD